MTDRACAVTAQSSHRLRHRQRLTGTGSGTGSGTSHRLRLGHRTGSIGHHTGSIGHRTVRSVTAQVRSVTAQADRSPHRPIGHRTGSIAHRTGRSVTAQAPSVTAQADRSPHMLDRSPHRPIGHRTGRSVTAQARSVTAQADRPPHRLDRSPYRPIGHRTVSIGHRTGRSVTAQGNRKFYFGEFLIDGNMSKAYFKNSKPDFEKRVYVLLGHRNFLQDGSRSVRIERLCEEERSDRVQRCPDIPALWCGNTSSNHPSVSFHRFPRVNHARARWLHVFGMDESQLKQAVCSRHFPNGNSSN